MRPDLSRYDRVLVAFSGGKDSLAALLHLLDLGVPPEGIELHHHDVDGGEAFMDWPCTPAYARALGAAFGVPAYLSWRAGGFAAELGRDGAPTAPALFETPEGRLGRAGGEGPPGVRGRFPQVCADLRLRWCSSALKIEVMAALIRNQPRFLAGETLVVTGERAEESPMRARYAPFGPHRTATRQRRIDHWRPVLSWPEAEVWAIIARYGVTPHPAYGLGWSRVSCRSCIFGSPNQWATLRALYPEAFRRIVEREAASGLTIQQHASVSELADRGRPYAAALANPALAAQAGATTWIAPVFTRPWRLPAGAFGEAAGPN
ncbi:MAG: phosphoadenosine phosphosulfate reductase family protein [Phenylobacterium sp.]|jgi:3'-phosphoadenosine 5'-phosphosulfate sulfotransferase (PAPS reductase)/FAD synthetase|uniref:phosphoadenosine phosphosulfate reductase domain-containing protein n=1 Tax=Phenylobacterium sp. TaxID=1871053 RepID=UPI00182629C8|nr:phosphoadenosine phosphosulfate reductase family protein [Phenylobacterium sp.]MBA4794413.1 phosphoadenosine phosphosulfate reductase family protein [Phenylobacterium sp.]